MTRKAPATGMPSSVQKRRCAIYTRKSSEEGLDIEFNSLDAQREACEAYIASQRAEGWVLVRDRYDDGGVSGGTLERPALKRLLADVEEGLVDVIVVYKIDRLSRSLRWSPFVGQFGDLAKLGSGSPQAANRSFSALHVIPAA